MRTLKKTLCLVLAVVMMLGLCAFNVSAKTTEDYSDGADIQYTEAVDVLSTLGVLEGDSRGFRPADGLTRAEACAIIVRLLGMGNVSGTATFTDTKGHWAEKYIAYCELEGYVNGYGDGKFGPDDALTGSAFAKMLLGALGYDAQGEGMTGETWEIGVAKLVRTTDLDDGLSSYDATGVITREQAAQLGLNTLMTPLVEYDSTTTVNVNGATVNVGGSKAKYIGENTAYGNNINDAKHDGKNRIEFAERYHKDLKLDLNNGTDDFGRPARKWSFKNENVGTYATNADLVETYTKKVSRAALYDLLGKGAYDSLVAGKTDLYLYEDGKDRKVDKTDIGQYIARNDTTKTGNITGNGTLTQVYQDEDENVTIVVINTYVFQASSDYRSASETLIIEAATDTTINLDSYTLDVDDFPMIKDIKEDDYLLITAYKNGTTYTVDSVAKAELLTGSVDSVVVKESVTLDGAKKSYSYKTDDDVKNPGYSVGQNATVVLDKYGYIIAVDEAIVAQNYVFIADIGSTSSINSKVVAKAYFTDGTNEEITIKELKGSSNKSAMVALNAGADDIDNSSGKYTYGTEDAIGTGVVSGSKIKAGWYTFSKNSSGEYTLYDIGANHRQAVEYGGAGNLGADTVLVTAGKVKFLSHTEVLGNTYYTESDCNGGATDPAAGDVRANDKTIFIVTDDDDNIDVYTGVKNIPDITLLKKNTASDGGRAIIFSVIGSSSLYADYVFVSLSGRNTVYGAEAESLVYFVKYGSEHKTTNNDTYYTYKILDEDAKETTVQAETKVAGTGNIYKAYYKTSVNSDGQYTKATALGNNTNAGKYFDYNSKTDTISTKSGVLTIGGVTFTLADDYKIVVVVRGKNGENDASVLNKDKGASYEAAVVTASGLEAMVNGYAVTYDVQGRTKDTYAGEGADELVEAYVTITKASDASKGTPSTTATIASVKYGTGTADTPITVYSTAAEALANQVTLPWASDGNWTVTATAGETTSTIAVTGLTGGTARTNTYSGTLAKSTAGAYALTITATAQDGTSTTVGYVNIKIAKTIALSAPLTSVVDSTTTNDTGFSATPNSDGKIGTKLLNLSAADTCAQGDIKGTLTATVYKMNAGGTWTDVKRVNKTINASRGANVDADASFFGTTYAGGDYKIEWTYKLDDGQSYSGTEYVTIAFAT